MNNLNAYLQTLLIKDSPVFQEEATLFPREACVLVLSSKREGRDAPSVCWFSVAQVAYFGVAYSNLHPDII